MNKHVLIRKIVDRLAEELEIYFRAARASRTEATHEQSKAENKCDITLVTPLPLKYVF